MLKENCQRPGVTPCEQCTAPGTITVNGRLYCQDHAAVNEKRASDHDAGDSFKAAVEHLTDLHGTE